MEENQLEKEIATQISQQGVFIAGFESTAYLPSFAFTIGLWEKNKHPEIICFGLSVPTLQDILLDLAERVQNDETLSADRIDESVLEDSRSMFLEVDPRNLGDYFGTAIDFYKTKDFPALQLVWTDRADVFPWEADFEEEFRYKQPLLDRNAEFKYFEPEDLGVYTTRQWLDQQKPILSVVHDPDGDWQFLTGDETQEDARVVSLEQMIRSDLTLNDVFDLDYGEIAERTYVGAPWQRDVFEFDEEE